MSQDRKALDGEVLPRQCLLNYLLEIISESYSGPKMEI